MARTAAPLSTPVKANHATPRRLNVGTERLVRKPAVHTITAEIEYPISAAAYGLVQSARPAFDSTCASARSSAADQGIHSALRSALGTGPPAGFDNAMVPSTMTAVAIDSRIPGTSPRNNAAPSTAKSGVVLPMVPATVGPSRRLPTKVRSVTAAG